MASRLRIALLIESSRAYGRGLLRGIAEYARTYGNWSIIHQERALGDEHPDWLRDGKIDGMIVRAENPEMVEYLLETKIPAVDLRALIRIPGVPAINTDDQAVVAMAIDHLADRGFNEMAFYGFGGANYSDLRCEHFRRLLSDRKTKAHVHELPPQEITTSTTQIEARGMMHENELARWIEQIPKPIGLMACNDIAAQQVLNACRLSDIAVPEDVAVIGVDNDEVICEISDPPLTSIAPDTYRIGYEAAQMLAELIAGKQVEQLSTTIRPMGVVERDSTRISAISDRLVATAMRFIREHVDEGINVEDLLDHLQVSRSKLERRFTAALKQTPFEAIIDLRLARVKQLLIETDLPLSQIARIAGFRHAEYMSVQFKRETGMTPGRYRNEHNPPVA